MRHRKTGRSLSRNGSHYLALMRNLTISLCHHHSIRTTHAKAKELSRFIQPLITRAKVDNLANKRFILKKLGHNRLAVYQLFQELGPHFKQRPGGYLRIIKCGYRAGDCAPMAVVQWIGYPNIRDRNKVNPAEKSIEQET